MLNGEVLRCCNAVAHEITLEHGHVLRITIELRLPAQSPSMGRPPPPPPQQNLRFCDLYPFPDSPYPIRIFWRQVDGRYAVELRCVSKWKLDLLGTGHDDDDDMWEYG